MSTWTNITKPFRLVKYWRTFSSHLFFLFVSQVLIFTNGSECYIKSHLPISYILSDPLIAIPIREQLLAFTFLVFLYRGKIYHKNTQTCYAQSTYCVCSRVCEMHVIYRVCGKINATKFVKKIYWTFCYRGLKFFKVISLRIYTLLPAGLPRSVRILEGVFWKFPQSPRRSRFDSLDGHFLDKPCTIRTGGGK